MRGLPISTSGQRRRPEMRSLLAYVILRTLWWFTISSSQPDHTQLLIDPICLSLQPHRPFRHLTRVGWCCPNKRRYSQCRLRKLPTSCRASRFEVSEASWHARACQLNYLSLPGAVDFVSLLLLHQTNHLIKSCTLDLCREALFRDLAFLFLIPQPLISLQPISFPGI